MKFDEPVNANYAATIIKVNAVNKVEGLDNLVAVPVLGYQALVPKDVQVGDIMVAFTAETQLSDEFARVNNLHRHTDRNADKSEAGYLEDSRRVKAIRLRGARSDALLLSLDSLKSFGVSADDVKPGDTFDKIKGKEICKKYVLKEPTPRSPIQGKARKVDIRTFPTHLDTENYWRNAEKIPQDAQVVVTQKLHGTSGRWGRVAIERDLTIRDRIAKFFGVQPKDHEYRSVAGSRMVVKYIEGEEVEGKEHFYDSDVWSYWAAQLEGVIPDGFLVYGEIVGWINDGPIQKNYTYDLDAGNNELYVYRVAVAVGSRIIDLGWDQVRSFCAENGLKHVPELWRGVHGGFNPDFYTDKRFSERANEPGVHYRDKPIPLSSAKTVDEGIVVRYDETTTPYLLKAKSPVFLQHETKLLDQGVEDIEEDQK